MVFIFFDFLRLVMVYFLFYCLDFRVIYLSFFFFFKQKPESEMRISDWSSDVCSSDLTAAGQFGADYTRTTGTTEFEQRSGKVRHSNATRPTHTPAGMMPSPASARWMSLLYGILERSIAVSMPPASGMTLDRKSVV